MVILLLFIFVVTTIVYGVCVGWITVLWDGSWCPFYINPYRPSVLFVRRMQIVQTQTRRHRNGLFELMMVEKSIRLRWVNNHLAEERKDGCLTVIVLSWLSVVNAAFSQCQRLVCSLRMWECW